MKKYFKRISEFIIRKWMEYVHALRKHYELVLFHKVITRLLKEHMFNKCYSQSDLRYPIMHLTEELFVFWRIYRNQPENESRVADDYFVRILSHAIGNYLSFTENQVGTKDMAIRSFEQATEFIAPNLILRRMDRPEECKYPKSRLRVYEFDSDTNKYVLRYATDAVRMEPGFDWTKSGPNFTVH